MSDRLVAESFPLLLNAALKSLAILGAAWLVTFFLRKRSAASKHLVWTSAFAALLAMPLFTISLPGLEVPMNVPLEQPGVAFHVAASASADQARSPATASSGAAAAANTGRAPAPFTADWRYALALTSLAGTGVMLAQMVLSWFSLWRIRRNARQLDPTDAGVPEAAREARVLVTRRGAMPAACGLFRPAILLPAEADEWTAERRRMVLLHELAHVRRGDVSRHVIARIGLSLYWWNPLAWMAWRAFVRERERAADDVVLASGTRASDYAGHLLEIARGLQSHKMAWAAVSMAGRSQLEGRLLAILDARANRRAPGRKASAVAVAVAAALVIPLAALQAQQAPPEPLPADIDAFIRAAAAQKNREILENTARGAIELRQYDVARKLLDSSLEIRARESGTQSTEYGLGLLKLAELEQLRNRRVEAADFYSRAVSVLKTGPEAAAALRSLAVAAIVGKDYEAAYSHLQNALTADPSMAAEITMWMAVLRQRQGNAADAETLYRQASSLAYGSPLAPVISDLHAALLQQQGRQDEANELRKQISAIRAQEYATRTPPLAGITSSSFRVGGGVSAPTLIRKVEPVYSEYARAAGYQGTVVLYVEIGPDGMAKNIMVRRSLGLGLDERAIEAVRQWEFKPGMKDGVPVTVAATIEVNFRLL